MRRVYRCDHSLLREEIIIRHKIKIVNISMLLF
nr:MAG TPA: hypothetical protein [Inoviridae sp.]